MTHRFELAGQLRFPGKITLETWVSVVNGHYSYRLSAGGTSCRYLERRLRVEDPADILMALFRTPDAECAAALEHRLMLE